MKYVSYHRTSTKEQHLDRGIAEITKYCADNNIRLHKSKVYTDQQKKSAVFSNNAIESYENSFIRIFKYLGTMKIEDIKPVDITNFLLAMQTKETIIRKFRNGKIIITDKPLSYGAILKHYTVLHSIFTDAYKTDEVVPINPMDKVSRPVPRKDDEVKEMQYYSVKEARHILKCLEEETLQWQVIIRLMLDTGARRGERAGLQWKNVNFDNCTIKIANNLQYTKAKGVYDTTPKGKKNRTIDVDPDIMSLMRQLKNSQIVKALKDYCFTQGDRNPIFPQTPTKHLKAFGKKHGVKNLHPHALRHTAATIAIVNGADISSVSAKLGHADKSTTLDMYTHADQEAIKKANAIYRQALYQKQA